MLNEGAELQRSSKPVVHFHLCTPDCCLKSAWLMACLLRKWNNIWKTHAWSIYTVNVVSPLLHSVNVTHTNTAQVLIWPKRVRYDQWAVHLRSSWIKFHSFFYHFLSSRWFDEYDCWGVRSKEHYDSWALTIILDQYDVISLGIINCTHTTMKGKVQPQTQSTTHWTSNSSDIGFSSLH